MSHRTASACILAAAFAVPTLVSAGAPPWVRQWDGSTHKLLGHEHRYQHPMLPGYWGYRPDWRTADCWGCEEEHAGFHRSTQAHSLHWEAMLKKIHGDDYKICEPDRQLEYFPKRPFLKRVHVEEPCQPLIR